MNVPIKRGMVIRHQGHLYYVADFSERHSGKMKPTVHVQLRDVQDGRSFDRALDELEPVEEVEHGYRTLQYLYARGDRRVFMDSESFEEVEFPVSQLQGRAIFMNEGAEYRVLYADGRPIHLELPENVPLHVRMTAAPEKSVGSAGGVFKEATLENDLLVRVPLFIKSGDLIRVDTRTRTYVGKERE